MRSAPVAPLVALLSALSASPAGADTYPRQPAVDAIHYVFRLTVTDTNDTITGEATAKSRIVSTVSEISLDLVSTSSGKGMTVSGVSAAGRPLEFVHDSDRLRVLLGEPPMQYLLGWRIHIAKQMLRDHADTIDSIAERIGYDSEPAFNRAFKKKTGSPPAAWRRRAAKAASE